MRVAITGVSGFIGSVIARHLAESGHQVIGLLRESSRRDHVEPLVDRFVVADQADRGAWDELLRDADAVIHISLDWKAVGKGGDYARHLQSNLVGSIELLEAAAPRPFVFLSTIAVHHDMRPRWEGVIDEDHPLHPGNAYGACKAAVEAHLWAAHYGMGQHTCAIRPCAVYGMDPRPARSIGFPFIEPLRRGEPFTRPGGGKFVHVDDVAAVAIAALDHPAAAGRPINLVDCYARWSDLATMIAEELGVDAIINDSSPATPKNEFTKDAAQALGVEMDRGHEGLRLHLRDLIQGADR